jgi:hypothetical protein
MLVRARGKARAPAPMFQNSESIAVQGNDLSPDFVHGAFVIRVGQHGSFLF